MADAPLHAVPALSEGVAARRLALVGVFAALAIVGRLAFLWAPNYALTYFVVFLAAVILGWRAGAAVAILAMTVTNLLLTGLSPIGIVNTLGMTLFAVSGGLARRVVLRTSPRRLDVALQGALLFAIGLFATLLFSVTADLAGFAVAYLFTPEGATIGTRALPYVLLLGLVFNLGPALLNAVLFAAATPAVIAALRNAGHLSGHAEPVTAA